MNKAQLRRALKAKAMEVIQLHRDDSEVVRQVEALLNRLGDTLSDECILRELEVLAADGAPWIEIFADN